MSLPLVGGNAALVLVLMAVLWLLSVYRRDVSIVDPWWSIAFLLITSNTIIRTGVTAGKLLLVAAVAAWAIRLWLHLLLRALGKPEDPRYARFRRHYGAHRYWWISLFQVFLLQGCLALAISAPLQVAAAAVAPDPVTAVDLIGSTVFLIGFGFEVVADRQLRVFRRDPTRAGDVLDSGLWRYSRHPNYFGESVLWWGFWMFALDERFGWTTVFAPMLMTWLLVRVSGVSMLDAHLRSTKPAYLAYMGRTPAFVPGRPRELT